MTHNYATPKSNALNASVMRPRNSTCTSENPRQHCCSEAPGVRVLPARVIAADERHAIREDVHRSVSEGRAGAEADALRAEQPQVGIERDCAEGDDRVHVAKRADFRCKMRKTFADFLRRRLVRWWRAAHGRGNECVSQLQSIVGLPRGADVGEAGLVQRRHQEVARSADAVAGEHASGSVGAVRRGSETDDEQSRSGIAESGHRLRPVDLLCVRPALLAPDPLAIPPEPRALFTRDDGVSGERQAARGQVTKVALLSQSRFGHGRGCDPVDSRPTATGVLNLTHEARVTDTRAPRRRRRSLQAVA